MQDILGILSNLRRPRLLIRAARIGAQETRRDAHLNRLLGYGGLPKPGKALMSLMELEGDMNDKRRTQAASYSISRHVEVLVAMMGEAQILASKTE